ncbi:uncharacterized protein A4U43_C01F21970 [Asparagus officinalis]|uniref:Uncharacterized protein n=1 Tax=Asparagus officinalis TaxID=4686 RepID=A0A5P1FTQ3_ASPOF|nr:uncharacterized protein A4U43_C01F21970 [Asparagus officinalis]
MRTSPREDDDESDDGEISSTTFEKAAAQRADLVGGGCTDSVREMSRFGERLRGSGEREGGFGERDERIWGEIERKCERDERIWGNVRVTSSSLVSTYFKH